MGDDGAFREDQAGAAPDLVRAIGKASEALEYVERARGHLYTFHQLTGRADFLFEEAARLLAAAGESAAAEHMDREVVGRNVLDGRWTFQIVDEYDELYYDEVRQAVRHLEAQHQGGRRHLFEARLKEDRRTRGAPGHEHRPPAAHDARVEVDG